MNSTGPGIWTASGSGRPILNFFFCRSFKIRLHRLFHLAIGSKICVRPNHAVCREEETPEKPALGNLHGSRDGFFFGRKATWSPKMTAENFGIQRYFSYISMVFDFNTSLHKYINSARQQCLRPPAHFSLACQVGPALSAKSMSRTKGTF